MAASASARMRGHLVGVQRGRPRPGRSLVRCGHRRAPGLEARHESRGGVQRTGRRLAHGAVAGAHARARLPVAKSGVPAGSGKSELGAAAGRPLHGDRPAVRLDQALHDVQAEAGAAAPRCCRARTGVKTRGASSGGMPSPSSRTGHGRLRRRRPDCRPRWCTVPSPCRTAFSTRLPRTWSILSGSSQSPAARAGVDDEPVRGLARPRPGRRRSPRPGGQVDELAVHLQPAGLDAGDVEQLGDQPGDPVGVGVDGLQHDALLVVGERVPLGEQRRGEALDAGQRGAQLVRDGGDQVGAAALQPGAGAACRAGVITTRLDRRRTARARGRSRP